MGTQRTYGKKRGNTLIANYARFAADSSGNETSPEVTRLKEISQNIQPGSRIRRLPVKNVFEVEDSLVQTTKCKKVVVVEQVAKKREPLMKCECPPQTQSAQETQTSNQDSSKTGSLALCRPSVGKASGRDTKLAASQASPRRSPRKTTPTTTDDLSNLFTSLKLNSTPESSVIVPQTPVPKILINHAALPPRTMSYLKPILSCKNVTPIVSDFASWMTCRLQLCLEKVGEGSFGEVFRATSPDGNTVILKLVPLNAEKGRGSKSFTSVKAATNEIKLLERMQRVPGFVEFRGACVLTGSLPPTFINLWQDYKSSGRTVESRDPRKKTAYSPNQLWLLLEMSDAGRNLEAGQYAPPGAISTKGTRYMGLGRTWDIFWEVVKSIAKAEYYAQFEHRDLHLGNICARDSTHTPDTEDLAFTSVKNPKPIPMNRSKIEITIIDYSLSRAFVEHEDDVLYYDWRKDKDILKGEGDMQYDMYRYVDALMGKRSPRDSVPQTNLIWLWFLLNRLLGMTKELSSRAKARKHGFVTVEARMASILVEVQELTDPKGMEGWVLDSATGLLGLGIERGWLAQEDVFE